MVTFTGPPPLSCAAVSVPIFMNAYRLVCAKARITHSTRACWAEIADKQQAAQWLLLAERQMDEASVFTHPRFLPAHAEPECV